MSAQDNGGPAFPAQFYDERATGMTMRDYFAAKAIVVATKWEEVAPTYSSRGEPTFRGIAERAYLMADAMLAAREGA